MTVVVFYNFFLTLCKRIFKKNFQFEKYFSSLSYKFIDKRRSNNEIWNWYKGEVNIKEDSKQSLQVGYLIG